MEVDEMKNQDKNYKKNLENLKTEVASELGVDLKRENITAKEAGTVGGNMVKKMVDSFKNK